MAHKYKKEKDMLVGHEIDQDKKAFAVDFEKLMNFIHENPEGGPVNAKDVAEYATEILTEVRDLAANAKLTFLAYFIQVAVEEAKIQAEEHRDG
jgi:hypothetical protein